MNYRFLLRVLCYRCFDEFERLDYQMIFNIYLVENTHLVTQLSRSVSSSDAPALRITHFLSLLLLNLNAMKSRLSKISGIVKSCASIPSVIKTHITIAKLVQLVVIFMHFVVLSLLLNVFTIMSLI